MIGGDASCHHLARSNDLRTLRPVDHERREQTAQIRSAARKGGSPAEIANALHLPLTAVRRVLAAVDHSRLSDPTQLLKTRKAAAGLVAADVQLYWLGFLTAAGHIWGQGSSLTLVITLGDKSQAHMGAFMADLADPHVRYEFCRSSLLGWQLYIRDQALCTALIPWGILSDLHGDDPSVLDDLPEEFAIPFLRGYVDGNWPAPRTSGRGRSDTLVLFGPPAVLAGINNIAARFWRVPAGVVTERSPRAELRFTGAASRGIMERVHRYTARERVANGDAAG